MATVDTVQVVKCCTEVQAESPTDPLLPSDDGAIVKTNEDTDPTTSSEKSQEKKATEKCAYFWNFIFYVFCFLAGQYINFEIIRKPSSVSQPEATPSSDSRPESSTWKKFISGRCIDSICWSSYCVHWLCCHSFHCRGFDDSKY